MKCKKCGSINKESQKFCTECGTKLTKENVEIISKSEEARATVKNIGKKMKNHKLVVQLTNKWKSLSKQMKIIITISSIALIVILLTLGIIVNNPINKYTSYIDKYYSSEDIYEYLNKMSDIILDNENKPKVYDELKTITKEKIEVWITEFNQEKYDLDLLEKRFNHTKDSISAFGSDYIISDLVGYQVISNNLEELDQLYESKKNYLKGMKCEDSKDKYAYLSKVIEKDTYYQEAQDFINNYLKELTDNMSKEVEELKVSSEDKEVLRKSYEDILEYLNNNAFVNTIDLSKTTVYKDLLDETIASIAQLNLEEAKTKIIEVSNAKDKYDSYKNAYQYLKDNSYVKEHNITSEEIEAFKLETQDIIYQSVTEIIDGYKQNYQYEELRTLISEALNYVENDKNKELQDLSAEYKEKGPFNLVNLDLLDESYHYSLTKYTTTIGDVKYQNSINLGIVEKPQYVEFNLKKEYNYLKAVIAIPSGWKIDTNTKIIIYGDGKELFNSGKITATNEYKANIEIDVTDITRLKIESTGSSNKYKDIKIANAQLYKK